MNPSIHLLSASPARQVRLTRTPRAAMEDASAPGDSSPIRARAPRTRSNLAPAHALIVRFVAVAICWALLGIYCAEVFSAFRSH